MNSLSFFIYKCQCITSFTHFTWYICQHNLSFYDIFSLVYPKTCACYWAVCHCSVWASVMVATHWEACNHSELDSCLLHAAILTKPCNFVLCTITDINVALLSLFYFIHHYYVIIPTIITCSIIVFLLLAEPCAGIIRYYNFYRQGYLLEAAL